MKDSGVEWIGEIPEEWETRRLKYILSERKEKNDPIVTKNILSLSVEKGVFPYAEKTGGGNKAKEDLTAYKVTHPEDIVLNSMNILAGAVGLSKYTGVVSPVYYTLYSEKKEIDINYYYLLFQTQAFQKSLLGLGNGIMMKESSNGKLNTIRMRIPMDKLNSVILPIPDIETQNRIVDKLNSKLKVIDDIIAETQQSIEELKKYKQALITEVVTKGLDANVEMKDSGIEWIGTIPVSTKLRKIKTFLKVKNGKEIKEDTGEISVYGSGGAFKKTNEIIYDRASVLFGRKGTIGKPLLVKEPFWTVDTMFYTQIMETLVELKWVYYLFTVLPWEYYTTQTALPSIVGTDVENIKVPYVSLRNQKKIVDYLDKKTDQIDSLIMTKQQVVFEYQKYKNMIIYEYVTGKRYIK